MNTTNLLRRMFFLGGLAFAGASQAQVLELRATLNAAQETSTSTSPATGTAVMFYNVATNVFDLVVSINIMSNTATASHLHEAPAGVAGGVVTDLGGEAVYTRVGNTLRATFREKTYGGDKLTLIQGGAYYNIHSAQFPGGEIRGQLIPQPKKLVANFTVAQEQAAFPNVNLSGLNDFGAAVMLYNPATHTISLRMSLYHFNNPFSNSHFHVGARGVSGPVAVALGTNPNAGHYSNVNGHISGSADIPMTGADPIALLTGGLYLNFHSTTFPGGELRGQVTASDELVSTRFSNMATRGYVGTGEQVLIEGITVSGPDPMRAVITVKGPSLSQFGIATPLANPRVSLHDIAGRMIAWNDDVGTPAAGSEMTLMPGLPTNPVESALVVVLPPGSYTAIVSGNGGTGIALLEVNDLRNAGLAATAEGTFDRSLAASPRPKDRPAPELCVAPLAVASR